MSSKISAIVPVYNEELYVRRCVGSITGQSYTDLEIILVDDGSTDSSGRICDELAAGDPRITVIHKINGGLSSARNAGLEVVTGEILFFVDSDDWLHKDYVRILYEAVGEADFAMCLSINAAHGDMNDTDIHKADIEFVSNTDFLKRICQDKGFNISGARCMFHRHLFSDVRYQDGLLYEDILPMFLIAGQSIKVALVHNYLYYYNIASAGITRSPFKAADMDLIYQWNLIIDVVKNYDEDIRALVWYRLFDAHLFLINKICKYGLEDKRHLTKILVFFRKHKKSAKRNPYISKLKYNQFALASASFPIYKAIYHIRKNFS